MGKHWTKDEENLLLATVVKYQNSLPVALKEVSEKTGRSYKACYSKYMALMTYTKEKEEKTESTYGLSGWKWFCETFKRIFR